MNLTTRKKERAKQAREKKQLKKDITAANKDFFKTMFKNLHNEI
jgi:hypothetical protein